MATRIDKMEESEIEKLAETAELLLEKADTRKDLKEKRGVIKQTLYHGSEKLKHLIPKGKHL